MPSGPHTPARGGSRQGTPARGRARAASPTPAAPAAATTTPTTRTNVEEERRASHRARRPTTRNTEQAREGNARTRPERNQAPSGPSAAAKERRNILIKNVFMADTVNVSTSRFCSSRSHAAQGASPPQNHTGTRPPPTVRESSSASEDERFVSPFGRAGSSPDTEIDVELGLDDDMDSGPEAVSEISFVPSPRRPRNGNLQRETSAPASRYGTPLSRQGSGSVTAVSRVHERTKTTSHSKSSSSRTETQSQRRATTNLKAEGPGLSIDTGMKRLSLSSSPPTGETQREDGQLPWTWQRPLDVPVPDTDFSISAALRSNKSRSGSVAGDGEYDIVATRPNTPPPPALPPVIPAAASRSSSSSQRSQRPVPVVAVASIKLCDGCSQPLPNPPLPPPRSMSKSSSESSHASTSVRPCRSCYQPLPSVTVTPISDRASGSRSRSGSSRVPSRANTMPGSFDEYIESPAIRTSRSGSGSGSRSNASTYSHSRSNSTGTSTQAPPSPSRHRNALGLAGTGLSSPSSLHYSGAGSDPRSPLGRSDTLSEIGSPRAQMMSFQSLSVLS
ncbi:hypothetical protein BC629DRAFT_953452 [Irpex lacteus]|nr:hypothetical protein BC629DRAFT_953452 [Irpex lacteus]